MNKTPITTLIEFINDTAVKKEISDEVKNALSEFSIYITEKAIELQVIEEEAISSAFETGQLILNQSAHEYYCNTFEVPAPQPVMMNQEEFDKHIANAEKVD